MGVFVAVLFLNGCTACNSMLPSKKIKIPPYVINYYHFENPEEAQAEVLPGDQWYEHSWNDTFRMAFKIARVEVSGTYIYRLLYTAVNGMDEKVVLPDPKIELLDSATGMPIQQVGCWDWQTTSTPCNVATLPPQGKTAKEIRYGYSTDETFAQGLSIRMKGLSFIIGETIIHFYARRES
jgi:hypothetical protein